MSTPDLLTDFPPVSTQEWEDAIRKDLKGADYARKLIWQTEEGIGVRPYLRADQVADLPWLVTHPGDFPYVRSTTARPGWKIREEIEQVSPEVANHAARTAIAAGAEEISFRGVQIRSSLDLVLLLSNLEQIPLSFPDADLKTLQMLVQHVNLMPREQAIFAGWNPLDDLDKAAEVLSTVPASIRPFCISGESFEKRGATAVEEIGLSLAAAVDLIAELQSSSFSPTRIAEAIEFSFAAGSNFFMQIAKLRAFRLLWARALESFAVEPEHAKARIHVRTTQWNQTIYDAQTNILRSTTEAMAAVLGGADSITVTPYDLYRNAPNEASRRLARNTQLILRHEAQLARVCDPGGGSYLLEHLTDSIASHAWGLMQEMESAGGYRAVKASGLIDHTLDKLRDARSEAVAKRRCILAGTNRYADPGEKVLDQLAPTRKQDADRGAIPYERLRLLTEKHASRSGRLPSILLAEFGDAKMRRARSQFAADVFACAGLSTTTRFCSNADEIASYAADLIVLCSSDAEYFAIATELLSKRNANGTAMPIVIAGSPQETDQLKAAGIDSFLNVRTDVLAFLTAWQQRLGITE